MGDWHSINKYKKILDRAYSKGMGLAFTIGTGIAAAMGHSLWQMMKVGVPE